MERKKEIKNVWVDNALFNSVEIRKRKQKLDLKNEIRFFSKFMKNNN